MSDDPSYWLDHFNGDSSLAALVVGGLTRRRCPWCERELRPCNLNRHIDAQHFRQLTIDEAIAALDALPADATIHDAAEALQPVVERAIARSC